MIPDPTEEIREIKRRLSAEFDNDLHRIAVETRRRQNASGRKVVTLPPRVPQTANAVNRSGHPSGTDGRDSS